MRFRFAALLLGLGFVLPAAARTPAPIDIPS